jgi:SPP1 gp7 family putative phage head morphogenesis protein
MPATVNERLLDLWIGHLTDLHRHTNLIVADIERVFRAADAELARDLYVALSAMDAFSIEVITRGLANVNARISASYQQALDKLIVDLRAMTEYELNFTNAAMKKTLPTRVELRLDEPSPNQTFSAALAKPFQGHLLSEWFNELSRDKQRRVTGTIRQGFINGETIDQMVRSLRGTKAAGYSDGLLVTDRRNAESVVRTSVGHFAAEARAAYYRENDDIVDVEQWVSTLDNRTTEMCQIRDGLLYTVGDHKPVDHRVPWLGGPGVIHWNCRSASVPVVKGWKALGIELPPLERAAMDGKVAGDTTYGEWLAKQTAARQDEILGPTRGALFRKGELAFDRFFNNKGDYLTLDELKLRDAAAFRRAGV